jgi:lipid II:glycine glycyltransferase (peptidoglycan interpeptide bridge formation enzyme)
MLSVGFHKKHFRITQVWFANRPKRSNVLGCYEYYQCASIKNVFGFIRKDKYTKLIDLTKSPDELLGLCNRTTQYQIKRSINEGVKFLIEPDINAFIYFYNKFASSRNMRLLENSDLASFNKNNLFISKVIHEGECLVMHANIIDQNIKRVGMLNSASLYKTESDNKKRALMARANRFLHFEDMIYAKNKNMLKYDFGGYTMNTDNKILLGINKFKDGFGGKLIRESNYTSYPLWFLRKLKRFMNL